ncbi:hypothetical protein, partial [Bifidobacterium catenulatum]|uniref:hypothetical protein n=1 Tax=Bifidobacterium catenulatum TaxID=1686 RepID=UPI0034A50E5E
RVPSPPARTMERIFGFFAMRTPLLERRYDTAHIGRSAASQTAYALNNCIFFATCKEFAPRVLKIC